MIFKRKPKPVPCPTGNYHDAHTWYLEKFTWFRHYYSSVEPKNNPFTKHWCPGRHPEVTRQ